MFKKGIIQYMRLYCIFFVFLLHFIKAVYVHVAQEKSLAGIPEIPGMNGLGSKSLKDVLEWRVKGMLLVYKGLRAFGEQVTS